MVAMKQVKFHTVLYMWLPPAHIQHLTSKNSSQSGIKGCCQCSENPLLPFLHLLHPYEVFETTWSERIVQGRHQCCLLKVQQVSPNVFLRLPCHSFSSRISVLLKICLGCCFAVLCVPRSICSPSLSDWGPAIQHVLQELHSSVSLKATAFVRYCC